jgi:fluoride exporter
LQASAFLLVFIGGGIGSVLRYAVNQASAAHLGMAFPWGTLFVNIAGSFAIGAVASWFAVRVEGGDMTRLFLTTGVLGGFTTFSAFSLDAALLWERGQTTAAVLYIAASVVSTIAAVFAGMAIVRHLLLP